MENFQEIVKDEFQKKLKQIKIRVTGTDNPSRERLIRCSLIWIARYFHEYLLLNLNNSFHFKVHYCSTMCSTLD